MKHRLRIVVPVLLLVIVGIIGWHLFLRGKTGPPSTIPGNGVIEATDVDVSAKVAGKVLSLKVDEGNPVKKGELLSILDSDELSGDVDQAQGNLQAAEAALAALQAGSRPEDVQRAQAQYAASVQTLHQAEAHNDLVKAGTRKEDIAQLEAAYKQARAQLSLLQEGTRKEELAQQRAAYAQAKSQEDLLKAGTRPEEIAQLREALSQTKITLANAKIEQERTQRLLKDGAVSQQRADQVQLAQDVAQTQVNAAQQRLDEAIAGPRTQELQAAAHQTEVARQRLAAGVAGARPQEIAQARQAVEMARQKLSEAKAGARPQELQEAAAAVAQAQSQAAANHAALDLVLHGARKEDIDAAKARVAQARGTLATAEASRKQTKIFCPTDGRVTLRNVEPGELVTPGLPIVRIAELQNVWLRVYVPEPQVGLLKIGQRAVVTTDSSPKKFEGHITEIAEQPEFTPKNVQTKDERVKLVFGVKIGVENPEQELKPGMPADAVIYVK